MSLSVDALLKQLEEKARNVELPLERRLSDTALWWFRNRERIPRENVPDRLELTEKMLGIVLEMLALATERIQHGEGMRSAKLWLPNGMSVSGDLKRFG